ncbi:MAG: hypothetical protein IT324_23550 [Anaerolineae bacterium]|nr:hypothetical protein [Anaerolineae bacterium]
MNNHPRPTSFPLPANAVRHVQRFLFWLTQPNPQIQRPAERRQVRLLLSLLTAFMAFSLIVVVVLACRAVVDKDSPDVFGAQLSALLVGQALLVMAYVLARRQRYRLGAIMTILCIMATCTVAAVGTQEPFAFAFLSFATLIGALFLSPRSTILITIISVLMSPVYKAVYLHRTWRFFGDETIFLLGISLINLLVIIIRRADLDQIEQQSRELIAAEKRRVELIAEHERTMALRQFISNVSHDFRTPLTAINASAYVIKRITDPSKQQTHAAIIEQQAARLTTLINDMVAVIRLDNTQDMRRQAVHINQLVEQVAQSIRPTLRSKNLTLDLELDTHLPPLAADRFALEMALRKLLDNAIQYNHEGGTITVQTAASPDNIMLCVSDTGIGIEAAHLPHIFDLLYRVDQARSTQTGGAGLGLPIVKKIVEAHGGTIGVMSVPHQQTTFTITLPLNAAGG